MTALARLATGTNGYATDPHTRYRSTFLLDELFHELVRGAKPELFIEAGAFEAAASVRVRREVAGARVVAFEANPRNAEHFRGLRDYEALGVDYRQEALAEGADTATMQMVVGSSTRDIKAVEGFNGLLRRTDNAGYLGHVTFEEVVVPATTLNATLNDAKSSALWMDVEGASGIVLAGGNKFLEVCQVAKIEVESEVSWVGQWLDVDVVAALARHKIRPVARDTQGSDQYNLIFVSDALLRRSDVSASLDHHGRRSQRELRRQQSRLRRHPAVRGVGRKIFRRS